MKIMNPFKFGSIVDKPYFTNRVNELQQIKNLLQSQNHLILISPRRYGKTSLMTKVVSTLERPSIFLNLQLITDVTDFAAQLLKRIYRIYPFERLKQLVKNFRIVPSLTMNPSTNEVEISFQGVHTPFPLLEDVLNLLETLGGGGARPILVLDEFQEIVRIGKGLDRQLRAIMQVHKNINYAFLGSMESMMREIFEKKKSPFYHFGQLIPLGRIPKKDFKRYLIRGFEKKNIQAEDLSEALLNFTKCHPYYTQQLAYTLWDTIDDSEQDTTTMVSQTINKLIQIHDMDYERLWLNQNQTDRKILIALANKEETILNNAFKQKYGVSATSTVYSSVKRLMKQGYINKVGTSYELDDPFFAEWIKNKRKE
jgi:AAA+ ATPase superfamily predicted ATPase